MKKLLKFGAVLLTVSALVACGQASKKDARGNEVASANGVEVKIKSGTYVVPQDESADNKYLALKVEVKNTSDKKLNISESDFTLYNSDDEKLEPKHVYDSNDKFQTFGYEGIAKGKSASAYVVYEVNPKEKYELHYSPLEFDAKKKDKDIELKVDASKFEDNTEKITDLAKSYVDQVFLNGENSGGATNVSTDGKSGQVTFLDNKSSKKGSFVLANDIEKERNNFIQNFIKSFGNSFTYYKPSDAEYRTFVEAYIKANAKRAKITYTIKSYLPDSAEVYVRPEVIDLDNLNVSDLTSQFVQENSGKYSSYSEAVKAAEKYVLEQAPSKFESTPLDTPKYMDKNGYLIKMTRKNDKWTIDTSDYTYTSLEEAFMGGN